MQVIVYKNLRRGDWSIAALKGQRGRGPVIAHAAQVTLSNVTFFVSEASRQTVIAKHERSVHAYCIGTMTDAQATPITEVTYNPYRAGAFTTRDGTRITKARTVAFAADGKAYLA